MVKLAARKKHTKNPRIVHQQEGKKSTYGQTDRVCASGTKNLGRERSIPNRTSQACQPLVYSPISALALKEAQPSHEQTLE